MKTFLIKKINTLLFSNKRKRNYFEDKGVLDGKKKKKKKKLFQGKNDKKLFIVF
jgi:hypothetical protein